MSAYVPADLRRRVRDHFANCCAYCRTAEHFVWNDDATELIALTATGRTTVAALRMNRSQLIRVRRMWVAMDEHPPDLA